MTYNHSSSSATLSSARTSTVMPYIVWGLGCLFYFYECLLQVSPSVMSNELMRDFSVTSHTLGILSGIYFYSYAAMQLPGGLLLDYFGPRRLLTIATAICASSTIAFGLTDSFFMACLARLMIGVGSAFAAIGTMKLAANWFSSAQFALMTGIMVTIGMLGAIGGETPLALSVDVYGWRNSMLIFGGVGLILALLIFSVAKDAPSSSNAAPEPPSKHEHIWSSFKVLLKDGQLWLVALYGGLMYLSTPVFCGLWGVPFLMFKLGLSKAVAANYISLVFVGWAIASPLWGIFSNRIGKRKPPMYIGAIGGFFVMSMILYTDIAPGLSLQMLMFFFGVFSAGFLPAFSMAKELCNPRYVATGLGFMNMMNMVGIALIQPLVGLILDLSWQGEIVNNIRVYPLGAYHLGLSILPAAMLISLLLLPRLKETYCQQKMDH